MQSLRQPKKNRLEEINMKAFVTGASGFIGLNIVDALLREKWTVVAMVRPTSETKYLSKKKVKIVVGNILDEESLNEVIPKGVDCVFHVAGNVSMWGPGAKEQYQDNVIGTKNMVNAALKKKAGRFIYTSSNGSYGHLNEHVTEETVSDALSCKNPYLQTKYLAEQEVHKAIEQGLDAVILNPANVIGAYDYHNWGRMFMMVQNGTLPGIASGTLTHSHAAEVAKAHVTAFKKGKTGEHYLLACCNVSQMELITGIGKMLGKKTSTKILPDTLFKFAGYVYEFIALFTRKEPEITNHIVELLTGHSTCSGDKAVKKLGYKQKTLEEMLEANYNWLKEENLLEGK